MTNYDHLKLLNDRIHNARNTLDQIRSNLGIRSSWSLDLHGTHATPDYGDRLARLLDLKRDAERTLAELTEKRDALLTVARREISALPDGWEKTVLTLRYLENKSIKWIEVKLARCRRSLYNDMNRGYRMILENELNSSSPASAGVPISDSATVEDPFPAPLSAGIPVSDSAPVSPPLPDPLSAGSADADAVPYHSSQ